MEWFSGRNKVSGISPSKDYELRDRSKNENKNNYPQLKQSTYYGGNKMDL